MAKRIVYAECPSPVTKEDYESVVESMFALVLAEESNSSWKSYSYSDHGEAGFKDIKIYDKETPDCPLDAMKVTGTIPASVQGLLELFWSFEKRKAYEKDLHEVTLVERITDNIEVIRTRYSAPFPVTSRQFVMVRAKFIKDGVAYIIGFSINHPSCVEESGYVLGVSRFNVTIIRPTVHSEKADQSFVTRVSQMDPKGSVPKFATSLSKSKIGEFMVNLRKLAAKA